MFGPKISAGTRIRKGLGTNEVRPRRRPPVGIITPTIPSQGIGCIALRSEGASVDFEPQASNTLKGSGDNIDLCRELVQVQCRPRHKRVEFSNENVIDCIHQSHLLNS